ncbi:MAG: NAD(P)-binding domain-containing protein [Myxococcales bacterium]|nr:NAD(P)-binding domain-containing protein [Myxococcales bacterium]
MADRKNLLDLVLVLIAAAAIAWLYQQADGFYDVPPALLVDHPEYDRYRSAGFMGKVLGSAAVVFFVINLLYLPRRRMRVLHKLGTLRHWMSAHVFFGLLGGGLIALHSVFRMTSDAARWSAWAVVVLIATGIVGRYLYALVPHTASGDEEPDGLAGKAEQALARVATDVGGAHPLIAEVRAIGRVGAPPERNLLLAMIRLPLSPLTQVAGRIRVNLALRRAAADTDVTKQTRAAAREAVRYANAFAVSGAAAKILRGWRSIHLIAAMIMAWTAYVHIESAFAHGYGWKIPDNWPLWAAGAAALPVVAIALEIRLRTRRKRRKVKVMATDGPAPEPPATLHPYIDPNICMGSGACVASCPEGDILDLLDGRSRLVEPSHCIGHGECASNCPVGAISLVYGTSKRGVDIPHVSKDFESNVPGIYLVGEITGMGLIANAVRQGNLAVDHLIRQAKRDKGPTPDGMVDVCIIGAGPAGIAATLAAMEAGLTTVTLEQEPDIGGAINHYPRRKLVMLTAMDLRGYKKIRLPDARKEELVDLWKDLQNQTGLKVTHGVKVSGLTPLDTGFVVETKSASAGAGVDRQFKARRVLIAVGRRGTPRKLGVRGEEQSHVAYTVLEPDQHTDRQVVVVGGGDSALEAALACAEAGASGVSLVYRRKTFDRAKAKNRQKLDVAVADGQIALLLERSPAAIGTDTMVLDSGETVPADDVIICVGGTLPTGLLKAAGCEVEAHFGRPL